MKNNEMVTVTFLTGPLAGTNRDIELLYVKEHLETGHYYRIHSSDNRTVDNYTLFVDSMGLYFATYENSSIAPEPVNSLRDYNAPLPEFGFIPLSRNALNKSDAKSVFRELTEENFTEATDKEMLMAVKEEEEGAPFTPEEKEKMLAFIDETSKLPFPEVDRKAFDEAMARANQHQLAREEIEKSFTATDVIKQRELDNRFDFDEPLIDFKNVMSTIDQIKQKTEANMKANMNEINASVNDAHRSGIGFLSVTIEYDRIILTHLDSDKVKIEKEDK